MISLVSDAVRGTRKVVFEIFHVNLKDDWANNDLMKRAGLENVFNLYMTLRIQRRFYLSCICKKKVMLFSNKLFHEFLLKVIWLCVRQSHLPHQYTVSNWPFLPFCPEKGQKIDFPPRRRAFFTRSQI